MGGRLVEEHAVRLEGTGCRTFMSLSQNSLIRYLHDPVHLLLSADTQVSTILQFYAAFHRLVKTWGLELVPQAQCLSCSKLHYFRINSTKRTAINKTRLVAAAHWRVYSILYHRQCALLTMMLSRFCLCLGLYSASCSSRSVQDALLFLTLGTVLSKILNRGAALSIVRTHSYCSSVIDGLKGWSTVYFGQLMVDWTTVS